MIYQTISEKYLVSMSPMLFIEMVTGLRVVHKWRDCLLEKLETAENDESAVMFGKGINDATCFLKDGENSINIFYHNMTRKDPDFDIELQKMLAKDMDDIKMDEWMNYINNCFDKPTDKDFFDVVSERYNKVSTKLFQRLDDDNLRYSCRERDGSLNPSVYY
tara:strand:+ start:63 stop:548 length:486 start_codon:yes stop_codon:yes gene_type:complete